MFDDDYYRVEDAADQLGTNPQQLLREAAKGNVQICVFFSERPNGRFAKVNINQVITSREDDEDGLLFGEVVETVSTNFSIAGKEVPLTHEKLNKFEVNTPYIALITKDLINVQTHCPDIYQESNYETIACPILMKHEDNQHVYVPPYNLRIVTHRELVITIDELNRLKALKAQQDGKPTLEELQAENEALKKQLDALSNSTTKGKQQQRELILSGWIAGKGLDTAKRMKQSDIHEELKRVHGLFQIAESTFKDFWQAQKLIKLDTGKR